jgi:hypothetical protein
MSWSGRRFWRRIVNPALTFAYDNNFNQRARRAAAEPPNPDS